MKTTLTMDELDALCDRVGNLHFKCSAWWPTLDELAAIKAKTSKEKYMEFLLWISETAHAPVTQQEKEMKSFIRKQLYNNLTILD